MRPGGTTPPPRPSGAEGSEGLGQLALYGGAGSVADRWRDVNWLPLDVPRSLRRGEFVCDETEVVQATYYCTLTPGPPNSTATCQQANTRRGLTDNYHIFPEYLAHQLTPSVFIIPLPLDTLGHASPAILHVLVSVAIRHRIYRVASNAGDKRGLVDLRSKYYHHRAGAISALNNEIYSCKNVYTLMVGALVFVFAEVCPEACGSPAPPFGGASYNNMESWLARAHWFCSSSSRAPRHGRCIWMP